MLLLQLDAQRAEPVEGELAVSKVVGEPAEQGHAVEVPGAHGDAARDAGRDGREIFRLGDGYEVCPLPPVLDDEDMIDDEDGDENGKEDLPEDWLLFGTVQAVTAEGLVWMPLRREHSDDGL